MLQTLQALYPHVPVFVQNLGISLYGYTYRNERLGGHYERYAAEFTARDRWSPGEMQNYVEAELRRVLLHAYDEVSFYRSAWTRAGLGRADLARIHPADLPRIPITSKDSLRRDPDAFVAADVARRHKLHRYYTSGSTGTPVTTICDAEAHRRFVAGRDVRSFGWAGVSVRSPRSMIGGRLVVPRSDARPPFYRYNLAERQTYFSAYHISPDSAANYVDGFNRFRPEVLTGYAYSHYLLGRMMLAQGLKLAYRPKAAILGSEKLTPEMRAVVQEAFGTRAYEEYGAVENCVLVTECEAGRLHANPDFGILEVVGPDGLPVPPGVDGRIVCTGLLNDAQPMVRYEIGDVARFSEARCTCGREHLPVVEEIVGRIEDVVVAPDGRELVRFHGVFVNLPTILEGQVIQEALDLLRVRVVANDRFSAHDEATIRNRIIRERLGDVRVVVERVPQLERTELGKVRAVISRLPSASSAAAAIPS
jgi:phenylacetate-CoA ligase